MTHTMTITEKIAKKITENIKLHIDGLGSLYFTCIDSDGDKIVIRTSNHNCNGKNNYYRNQRCLSFISGNNKEVNTNHENNIEEWVVNADGEIVSFSGMENLEGILNDYSIVSIV